MRHLRWEKPRCLLYGQDYVAACVNPEGVDEPGLVGDSEDELEGDSEEELEGDSEDEQDKLEDGGGITSDGDWLHASAAAFEPSKTLRNTFQQLSEEWNLKDRVVSGFQKGGPGMFSAAEIGRLRQEAVSFLRSKGFWATAEVAPDQPLALEVLQGMLDALGDADAELPSILREGVPVGVFEPIAPSAAYEPEDRAKKLEAADDSPLLICESNWPSAENNPSKVEELLEKEIGEGWMEHWPGGLSAARAQFGERVAVGKLALIEEPGKEARLVGDSAAPGASSKARFPNRMRHPRVRDVRRGIRRCWRTGKAWKAFTIDVKAAHKRIKIACRDGGMAFFQFKGKWYRYKVAHFGASWSAWYWQRLAGALLRVLHVFLGVPHVALTFVDDTVVMIPSEQALELACLAAMLMEALGVPLSYHKLKVASLVDFIGFRVSMDTFSLGVTGDKRDKLLHFFSQFRKGERMDKLALQKETSRAQWVSEIVPEARPWLGELYRAINKPGLEWRTLDKLGLAGIFEALDGENRLRWSIPGMGLAKGWSLCYVGRHQVKSSERWRGWKPKEGGCLAFANWDARRVRITDSMCAASGVWEKALEAAERVYSCTGFAKMEEAAAADAMASGDWASLGGWWQVGDVAQESTCKWYRLEVHRSELESFGISIRGNMADDIAFFEALAQVCLLECRTRDGNYAHTRWTQDCDNQSSVGALRKNLSTATPMDAAVRAMASIVRSREIKAR